MNLEEQNLNKPQKPQLNIGVVSGSWKEIEIKAQKWFDDMSKEEWDDMERKHGYYGHDIGSSMQDIIDMYKAEFNDR